MVLQRDMLIKEDFVQKLSLLDVEVWLNSLPFPTIKNGHGWRWHTIRTRIKRFNKLKASISNKEGLSNRKYKTLETIEEIYLTVIKQWSAYKRRLDNGEVVQQKDNTVS